MTTHQFPKGDRGGPGSMSAAEDEDQRRQAVINAAIACVNAWHGTLIPPRHRPLVEAVAALTASQPVDPQTLELGTKFQFEGAEEEGVFIIIGSPERSRRWLNLSKSWTGIFCVDDRVIPLPDKD